MGFFLKNIEDFIDTFENQLFGNSFISSSSPVVKEGGFTKGGNHKILFIEKYDSIIFRISGSVISTPFIIWTSPPYLQGD